MEEDLISASEMAKKYDYVKVMAEKFYLDELQPKMLVVAKKQKFYTTEIIGNECRRRFGEMRENYESVEITSAVFELLQDLGYKYEITPFILPSERYEGISKLIISWGNEGDDRYEI